MKKRLGSILILMIFMCLMLLGHEGAQGQEAVYHAGEKEIPQETQEMQIEMEVREDEQEPAGGAKKQENADLVDDQEVMEEADDAESLADIDSPAFEEYWATLPERQPRVLLKYGEESFPAKYSDEVIDITYTDDLSLLEEMEWTNHSYAYRDGTVYYRQYHAGGSELDRSGRVDSVTGGKREIACVNQEGEKTELFQDNGWGDIYLMGERLYMTECRKENLEWKFKIYSVDREGNDRIDYGIGEIRAVDEARNLLILEMQEGRHGLVSDIRVLDCSNGDCTSLGPFLKGDGWNEGEEFVQWSFEDYQDGWIYLSCLRSDGTKESDHTTELYAVSLEGAWQKIITLTSDEIFIESIIQLEVLGDRIFFTYGGYDGREQWYQGGKMISIKRDGTDYKAIEDIDAGRPTYEDTFFLRQDAGRTLLYFEVSYFVADEQSESGNERYFVTLWDVDTGTLYPSAAPYTVCSGVNGIYIAGEEVCAIPDRSGRIVKAADHLDDYIEIWRTEDDYEYGPSFRNLYFRDGYLYFTAEYGTWTDDVDWLDRPIYHIRMRMEGYRLKLGEDKAELLYAY